MTSRKAVRTAPQSRNRLSATCGLFLGALLAVVWHAPAAWVGTVLADATNQRISLNQAQGTVWQGSAVLVFKGGSGSTDVARLPGRISWHLLPTWLGLRGNVGISCCAQHPWRISAQAKWGGADVSLNAPSLNLPASVLAGLGTPWNTLGLQGQLLFSSESLHLSIREGRLALAGQAQLDVSQAHSRLSTLRPVGSYRVSLDGGDVPRIHLSTLEGALQLSGNGQWLGQRLRFSGEARALEGQEPALQNLLNIIGRRQGARSIITIG